MDKYSEKKDINTLLAITKGLLGKFYTRKIIEYLDSHNIRNENNNSFSANSIHKIMGGYQKNEKVISAVIEFLQEEQLRQDDIFKRLRKLKK